MSSIVREKKLLTATCRFGLVAEVGHFIVLKPQGLEPGLEAELLLVGGHQDAAQPERDTWGLMSEALGIDSSCLLSPSARFQCHLEVRRTRRGTISDKVKPKIWILSS